MTRPAEAAAAAEELDSRGGGRGGNGGGLDRNGFRCGPAKEGAAATPLIGSDSAQRGAEIEACIKDVRGVVVSVARFPFHPDFVVEGTYVGQQYPKPIHSKFQPFGPFRTYVEVVECLPYLNWRRSPRWAPRLH